jgi:hypothetical protein
MHETINCPGCRRKLQIPETLVGKDVQCPTCSTTFQASLDPTPEPRRPAPDSPEYREEPAGRPSTRSRRRRYDEDDDFDEDRVRRRRRDVEPHRGSLVLVLGILSIVLPFVGLVLGPIAWILGSQDLSEIHAGRMDPEGEGTVSAGRICGIIGTILHIVGVLSCFLYFLFVISVVNAMRRF